MLHILETFIGNLLYIMAMCQVGMGEGGGGWKRPEMNRKEVIGYLFTVSLGGKQSQDLNPSSTVHQVGASEKSLTFCPCTDITVM